jgi:hypothetical protein
MEQLVAADADRLGGGDDADQLGTDRCHAVDGRAVGLVGARPGGEADDGRTRRGGRRPPVDGDRRHALDGERLVEGGCAHRDDRRRWDEQVGERSGTAGGVRP